MRVISLARALTWALISSALPTKLRATSALTPSSVRSTSVAFCLSTVLMPVDTAASERSTSPVTWPITRSALPVAVASARSALPVAAVKVRSAVVAAAVKTRSALPVT